MLRYWDFDQGDPEFLCHTPSEFPRMRGKLTVARDAVREGVAVEAYAP